MLEKKQPPDHDLLFFSKCIICLYLCICSEVLLKFQGFKQASRSRWTYSRECRECQKYFDLEKENYLFGNNFLWPNSEMVFS